ncbi:MAG: carbohydrate ABC transporter permease [Thermomicrobiales bacterium]
MQQNPAVELSGDVPIGVAADWRQTLGRAVISVASLAAVAVLALQVLKTFGITDVGFANWRPVAIAFLIWSICLCAGLILTRGQRGEEAAFLLPAVLITVAFVIFPTIYALFIAFTSWNLSAVTGRQFTGFDNFRQMFGDRAYWEAMRNMVIYVAAVLAQYVIGFGLALLLNQQIRGRKFFRVIFLVPFMLSPIAVSFMIGKSLLNSQYGPVVPILEWVGFTGISFYEDPWLARLNIMIMDAWYSIPFMMVLLLAGLQGIPHEVLESARIDGASSWQTFRHMVFPLMLPISLTAIILRVIFELKLIDVVRVVTGGGPAGATDTITLFIYREGIQKTNVGYATALSQFYLLTIIVAISIVLWLANKWVQRVT